MPTFTWGKQFAVVHLVDIFYLLLSFIFIPLRPFAVFALALTQLTPENTHSHTLEHLVKVYREGEGATNFHSLSNLDGDLPRIDALQEVQATQMQLAQMEQVQKRHCRQVGKAIATQVQIGEIRKFRELLRGYHLQREIEREGE